MQLQMGMDALNGVENKKSALRSMIMCPDIESQGGLLFSCIFTQHHSESPTRQKCILLFLLKQSLMPRKRRGPKKKKKDLTDWTAVSIQFAVLFLKSPALASILSWGWWGRAADNLLCVCVCVCVCRG